MPCLLRFDIRFRPLYARHQESHLWNVVPIPSPSDGLCTLVCTYRCCEFFFFDVSLAQWNLPIVDADCRWDCGDFHVKMSFHVRGVA